MTRLDENAIHIYDAPNGQKQDYLNYGNMVKILSISDDWVEVRYAHGEDVKVGWCAYDELFSDLPTQYHYYTVTTTRFNYREGPGSDYEKAGTLLYADLIYVDREEDGWYHFANKDHGLKNNKSGWVKTKFVEISPTDSKVRIDPEKMQVVYGSLNVRANPDLNSVRIGGLYLPIRIRSLTF